jgi:arginase
MRVDRAIRVLGAASGRGAGDEGCRFGPEAARRAGLLQQLAALGARARWEATLAGDRGDALTAVRKLAVRLARRVQSAAARGEFPLVLGGDHSCAIGTWSGMASALRSRGALGLIWIDAHMDAHVPATSPSGNLHGMPLACLLGHGDATLAALAGAPALRPEHVSLVGVRSFETGEAQLLQQLGVRVFTSAETERRGLDAVLREAHARATAGTCAFGLTIDVDAVDPLEAPGVGTPEPGGLRARELERTLECFGGDRRLAALEIVEYNPAHDIEGRTAALVCDLATAVLAPAARNIAAASEPVRLAA